MDLSAHRLLHVGPRTVRSDTVQLDSPSEKQVVAKALYSSISLGTETLIFNGDIETGISLDSSLTALQEQSVAYPFTYGYCWVGVVEAIGAEVTSLKVGDTIFSFVPHQSRHVIDQQDAFLIPEQLAPKAATLLPSMETALSIVQDAAPIAGETIHVFGQGVIGLLTAWILRQFPLGDINTIEPMESRHTVSEALGLKKPVTLHELEGLSPADTTIEVSGNPQAFETALKLTSPQGKMVIGSWYGNRTAEINMGTHFHRGRIQIISSQVSTLRPALQGVWSKTRRLHFAMQLLAQLPHEKLSAEEIPFQESATRYPEVITKPNGLTHTYFKYGA